MKAAQGEILCNSLKMEEFCQKESADEIIKL